MARKSSLRDLAAQSKSAGLAAANSQHVANRVVEIDPALIHPGGVQDRIGVNTAEIERLAESIRCVGQKVPILVRPHPERPGEYQIVAGRRRLAACKHIELSVRAEIQDLDERSLVLGQVIENIAREDLSFIECARLAAGMIDEAGLQPVDIDLAFGCGKTERSRYLKIGRGVPVGILQWIGKAPAVGRPRWEQLVRILKSDEGAEARIREMLAAANKDDQLVTSDDRFNMAYRAATEPQKASATRQSPSSQDDVQDVYLEGAETPIARTKRSARHMQITLHEGQVPGFTAWMQENQKEIFARLIQIFDSQSALSDLNPSFTGRTSGPSKGRDET